MRPEPILTPDAHADVLYAVEQYASTQSSLGRAFLAEFERTTSLIREAPLLSTVVEPPVRRSLLRRFPYGVFFVAGSLDVPDVIIAVLDLRQDPEVVRRALVR
jgi:hypothetical protein